MRRVGIMQGRLVGPVAGRYQSFPVGSWQLEFERAAEAGLDCIEWIHDVFGLDENPLEAPDGRERLAALSAQHGVGVYSVCADYFMERFLVRGDSKARTEAAEALIGLIQRCGEVGVERIVLPFVDASSLSGQHERQELVVVLASILAATSSFAVELHLETDLGPEDFARLLGRLPFPRIRVNYDSGNSASLGYSPRDEFAAYGDRVGSVHIKDRIRGGGSVPLGTGDARFADLAEELRRVAYRGDFILQAARSSDGDEVATARRNRSFVEKWFLAESES